MSYNHTMENRKNYTISIESDDNFIGWGDHLCDEPLQIIKVDNYGREWAIYDTGQDVPSLTICRLIDDSDWEGLLNEIASYTWTLLPDNRAKLEYDDDKRTLYYKNVKNAAKAEFLLEYGYSVHDIGIEALQSRDSIYAIWRKSDFNKYAGGTVDSPSISYLNDILENNIWGFDITDEDGESVESCWGFVGDPEYCLEEARQTCDLLIKHDKKQRLAKLKQMIKNRVPLVLRADLLAQV